MCMVQPDIQQPQSQHVNSSWFGRAGNNQSDFNLFFWLSNFMTMQHLAIFSRSQLLIIIFRKIKLDIGRRPIWPHSQMTAPKYNLVYLGPNKTQREKVFSFFRLIASVVKYLPFFKVYSWINTLNEYYLFRKWKKTVENRHLYADV